MSIKPKVKKNRTSRFFFTLMDELVAEQKEAHKPVVVEYADESVVTHSNAAKATLTQELGLNIDKVRQFFVDELSPLTLSLASGSDQAREVIKRALDTEVSPEPFYRFEQMAHQAVLIRMSMFLEEFLGLPKGAASELLPKSRASSNQPPAPAAEPEGSSNRSLKGLQRNMQRLIDEMGDRNGSGTKSKTHISPTEG